MFKTPAELNIISIDPSSRSTGVFFLKQGKMNSYAYQKKDDRLQLLGKYVKHFSKEARDTKWDLLIIENYAFSRTDRSVTTQAEIGGIIRSCFSAYNIPILEIASSTWKSILQIPKMKKNTVQEKSEYKNYCIERFGFTFDSTDEVDAYYLFWCVVQISRGNFAKGAGTSIRLFLEEQKIKL